MILKDKYKQVLDKFIMKYKKDDNVIGILVSGSIIHSKPDKNSDLDVHIILNKSTMRERGNTWIDGVEIEYFINPISQINEYFRSEIDKPCTVHMLANSIVLYRRGEIVDKLIHRAKLLMRKKLPKMSKVEIENAKYLVDDLRKDLEDMYIKQDIFSFNFIATKLLDECLNIFYKIKREPLEKTKQIANSIKKIDNKFADLYINSINERKMDERYRSINIVVDYLEKMLGGKRTKEWKLKGKLTL